ncbi:MAG: hypothetical protein M1830_003075 [Pleopsidium flavum]|nr:MAG: hypothetical protein M1830_003075 [Pleopsidium flavum]
MTTLLESFTERLPLLTTRQAGPRPFGVPRPGPSTLEIDPPIALEPVEPEDFVREYAKLQDGDCDVQDLEAHLPVVEDSFYINMEADVVRASSLYLLHPINMALSCLASCRVFCQAEETHGPTARTDISWRYISAQREWVTLAVLEFKNTDMLVREEFAAGMADMRPRSGREPRDLVDNAREEREEWDNTWLGEGAARLARQARKYSERTSVGYVAIFDWKSMFIFNFAEMHEDNYKLAEGTWFKEDAGNHRTYNTFRILLFGMLVKALRRNGLVG